MTRWNGHAAGTSDVLFELLTGAHTGRTRFSTAQRALFTACEFWAAAKNRGLHEFLSDDPESKMNAAAESFKLIGLRSTALIVKRGHMQLGVDSPIPRYQIIEELEDALNRVDEEVDSGIADFAADWKSRANGLRP
jgi:hypothetical protein